MILHQAKLSVKILAITFSYNEFHLRIPVSVYHVMHLRVKLDDAADQSNPVTNWDVIRFSTPVNRPLHERKISIGIMIQKFW